MEGSHNTVAFPPGRGERPLYAEFSHLIVLCIRCCVRATNTSVDSVDKHSIKCIVLALIFVSTVSTNKKPYSIHNSIALIFCIDCLDMPFNVHSNYNADSNVKTSNYSKVRFKPLIYFELEQTSN